MKLLLGLTPKETQIVSELCSGKSLKEAAETGGIAFSTARSYLEKIFYKTETCSQVQLVSLIGVAASRKNPTRGSVYRENSAEQSQFDG
jgi:DNA-binding CsgD family transcriptional regulator